MTGFPNGHRLIHRITCETAESQLGDDRTYGLPAHCVTPNPAEQVLAEIADENDLNLGSIVDAWTRASRESSTTGPPPQMALEPSR